MKKKGVFFFLITTICHEHQTSPRACPWRTFHDPSVASTYPNGRKLQSNSCALIIVFMAQVISTKVGDQPQPPNPAWVKTLLNFAEELALNPHNLDDSKCPAGWLPNRRVGIDSKFKTCVRVLDKKLETVPHWAIQEMDYFERQELGDEESRVEKDSEEDTLFQAGR